VLESAPEKALESNSMSYDNFENDMHLELEKTADQHLILAAEAFEYWLSVMRWATRNHRIGQSQVITNRTGWSTYLKDRESDKRIYATTQSFVLGIDAEVTEQQWNEVQKILNQNLQVPIHTALFHDALWTFEQGDFRRAIIDLCVSVETYLRKSVWSRLPTAIDSGIRVEIEKIAIYKYLDKFFPNQLQPNERKNYETGIKKSLKSLFEIRNEIMHQDDTSQVNREKCQELISVVRKLYELPLP
jgi:hypothetical protein